MYKEITIINNNKDYNGNYLMDGKSIGGYGCIASERFNFPKNKKHTLTVTKDYNLLSEEDITEYVKFINSFGGYIKFSITNKDYIFDFDRDNYLNWNHFLFYYTVLRYIFYKFTYGDDNRTQRVAVLAIEYYNKFNDTLTEFDCFLLANKILHPNGLDDLHLVKPYGLISMDKFLNNIKDSNTFNEALQDTPFTQTQLDYVTN